MWSWGLTKLPGPARHVFYELYVIIDIFSRYVPGWLVAEAESGELAEALIADAVARNGAAPGTIHGDRGSSMTSKPVAQLLVDLGVDRSHSRPHVSDDKRLSPHARRGNPEGCPTAIPTMNVATGPVRPQREGRSTVA